MTPHTPGELEWLTCEAKEKLGRLTPFFREISDAAAEEPFLFLLLLAGLEASKQWKVTYHYFSSPPRCVGRSEVKYKIFSLTKKNLFSSKAEVGIKESIQAKSCSV